MATFTVTGNIKDHLGNVDPLKVALVARPSHRFVDLAGTGTMSVGEVPIPIAIDGSFTATLPQTNGSTEPTGFTWTLHAKYRNQGAPITGSPGLDLWSFGPFPLTANTTVAALALIVDSPAVDPSWQNAFRSDMDGILAAAEAARDEAHDLSQIDTPDALVEALVSDGGSLTAGALSATIATRPDRKESPRGGQRPTLARRPSLTIDQVWPNALADFRIVHASGATLYAVGDDTKLRKSTDSGATWQGLYYPGGLGYLAHSGMFHVDGSTILTTYKPFDLSAPKVIRSTDGGATFSDVVAPQANVDYLGPTSICKDPSTGHLYLTEYVTVDAATKATWKIVRSTDGGATWTTFHTFQRDATAHPAAAVRHGHALQWDPVSARVWALCGDGEQAAGLYRVDAAGTALEPVVQRSQLPAGISAGAVGLMFFPTHIAWGNDQFADSGVIRMARTEIGKTGALDVELTAVVQATSFYVARTKADGSEWVMGVSNENGSGGRLDAAMHLYRVADNGSTVDEVLTLPTSTGAGQFAWMYPVGSRVHWDDEPVWWATMTDPSPIMPWTGSASSYQIRTRLAWGGQSLVRPDATVRRPHGQPVSVSSGNVALAGLQSKVFGVTEAPPRATRLYILEVNRGHVSGSGFAYAEVYNQTTGAILKDEAGVDMQWQDRSLRGATLGEPSSPWAVRSAPVSPGTQIRFRASEILNSATEVTATITYAWGF